MTIDEARKRLDRLAAGGNGSAELVMEDGHADVYRKVLELELLGSGPGDTLQLLVR